MESIQVTGSKVNAKGGRQCSAQDWATVHWKTFDSSGGKKYEDSREYKKKRPVVFKIGTFHVAECWDVALVTLHAGESITIKCPPQ